MGKTDLRSEILQTVLRLEVAKGHLKWKVSDLARLTKSSRPLVYYHFGKTKEEILDNCVEAIATDYYGLTGERRESLRPEAAFESLARTRGMFLSNPALVIFYQKARAAPGPLCDRLVKIERRFQAKLQRTFPGLRPAQVAALHGLFHGMVSAPFLSDEGFREAYAIVGSWLSGNVR